MTVSCATCTHHKTETSADDYGRCELRGGTRTHLLDSCSEYVSRDRETTVDREVQTIDVEM